MAVAALDRLEEAAARTAGTELGIGRLSAEGKAELRTALVRDLQQRHGLSQGVVEEEVDKFLESGRPSGSNLARLERRVAARAGSRGRGAGSSARSLSPRDEAETRSVSEFSVASRGSLSARGPRGYRDVGALSSTQPTPPVAKHMPLIPETGSWSEVANHAKLLEVYEKIQKREVMRSRQAQMRQDLEQQMEAKKIQKLEVAAENQRIFHQLMEDNERWREAQDVQQAEARRKVLEVKREREKQTELAARTKEDEKLRKLDEDRHQARRNERELEAEKQMYLARREQRKQEYLSIASELQEQSRAKDMEKQKAVADQKQQVAEYRDMLARQEERNKPLIPKIKDHTPVGSQTTRKGEELYSEENVMKQLHARLALAEEADRRKAENQRLEKQSNQDFLFQQIAERDKSRRQALEQKSTQKVAVQAAVEEFREAERKRAMDQRMKLVQYRLELENQIHQKKVSTKPLGRDDMSTAEKAINRHLLQDAREMKAKLGDLLSESSPPRRKGGPESSVFSSPGTP